MVEFSLHLGDPLEQNLELLMELREHGAVLVSRSITWFNCSRSTSIRRDRVRVFRIMADPRLMGIATHVLSLSLAVPQRNQINGRVVALQAAKAQI